MKKHQLSPNARTRKMVCTVSAAALMLGVSPAATVGFNFQSEWQNAPAYTGKIVTAAAFGIPTNGWENLAPLRTGYYGDNGPFATNQVISTSTSSDGLNPLPQGSLDIAWGCTAANVTSFPGYGPSFGGPSPNPGEQQVYYSFLRDEANYYTTPAGGPIPYSLAITGLRSVWTNSPYVIELITSSDTASSFANANIGSLTSTQQVTYSSTTATYGNFGGLSSVSGPMTNDSINIWSDPAVLHGVIPGKAVAGTIAGFIITDKPVVSMSPQPVGNVVSPGDTVTLRVIVVGVPPLSLQWRNNGVPVPGATNLTYVISNVAAGAGNYDLVATNNYGSATSLVSSVVLDRLSIVSGPNYTVDSKPSGTPHDGAVLGATLLASSTDSGGKTRTGIAQFVASDPDQIAVQASTTDFDTTAGTIMFWMRSDGATASLNGGAALFDRSTSSGGLTVAQASGSPGVVIVQFGNAPGVQNTSVGNVSDGKWHHVAVSFDTTLGVQIYVDGVVDEFYSDPSGTWSWPAGQEIDLGLSKDANWSAYNGQMDDVRIYNRQLSATEVASVYSSDAVVDSTLTMRLNFDTTTLTPGITVNWQNTDTTFQSSGSVNGPWSNVTFGSSPYRAAVQPGQMFFRYLHTPASFITNPYDQ